MIGISVVRICKACPHKSEMRLGLSGKNDLDQVGKTFLAQSSFTTVSQVDDLTWIKSFFGEVESILFLQASKEENNFFNYQQITESMR